MRIFTKFIILCFFSKIAFANISMIRDGEIEDFLAQAINPIIESANLDKKNIKIYLVNDSTLNAFVSGGQNIFINTGLLRKFSTPDALIGVIAHEVGHIKAGHLVRNSEGFDDSKTAMILSYLLGVGAMAAGSYDGGAALILGGTHIADRMQQKYTRTQEEAADQYAIKFLDKIAYPADGLVKLLKYFENEFKPYEPMIDEYALSHPISQKRIDLIVDRTKDKKFSNQEINFSLQPIMNIILAKLEGFMDNPVDLIKKYKKDKSELGKYMLAIAYHRHGNYQESIELIDNVIDSFKTQENHFNLAYLYELKGQFLFESGHPKEALIYLNKAIKILDPKNSSLAKITFSDAVIAAKIADKEILQLTLKYLLEAKNYEKLNAQLYLKLSKIYYNLGQEGNSYLALANYNLIIEDQDKSEKYAKKAQEIFKKNNDEQSLIVVEDLLKVIKK